MDAMTYLRERVALFTGVTDENLSLLSEASSLHTFNKGQTILFKGATVDGLGSWESSLLSPGLLLSRTWKIPLPLNFPATNAF